MNDRLQELADSYLDHMLIAIKVHDRGAPFRDFIDNWNAFRSEHGWHRSSGDRPRWFNNPSALSRLQMLSSLDFQSEGAVAILAGAARDRAAYRLARDARKHSVKMIVDHAVPIGVMVDTLLSGAIDPTREGLVAYLTATYRLGLISHAEDSKLTRLGLRSSMPVEWDGRQLYARYEAAGIRSKSQGK